MAVAEGFPEDLARQYVTGAMADCGVLQNVVLARGELFLVPHSTSARCVMLNFATSTARTMFTRLGRRCGMVPNGIT